MNSYTLPVTCGSCGGELEHLAGSSGAAGTQTTAVARCEECGREWQVLVLLRAVPRRWTADRRSVAPVHVRECAPCRSCYVGGCRCVDCAAAESIYQRERHVRRKAAMA